MTTIGPDDFWPVTFGSHHSWPVPLLARTTFCDQTVLCSNFCELDPNKPWPMGLLFGICCSCLFFWAMDLPAPPNPLPNPLVRYPPLCCVVCRCGVSVLCVMKDLGAPLDPPSADPPPLRRLPFRQTAQIFALFFPSPATRQGFTRQHENSKRAHSRVPALQTPPKFHDRTPRKEERTKMGAGEGKKKAKFWASHPSKPHLSGPHSFALQASGPHPPSLPPNFGGPKAPPLGPHPLGGGPTFA